VQRVLAYGAEEAERLNHKQIGTEHLLLGLLREEKCFAAEILHERGLRLSAVREEISLRFEKMTASRAQGKLAAVRVQPRSDAIGAGRLARSLIGRDYELERVVQILWPQDQEQPRC